ncbi:hypothetical protein AF332_11695 [Sporosarcina globispora]|uniref:Bacteriophage lambda Replication protein O N-terminal domain-containing protein n=1 Tax=Sporosarcina globispora TaxID=1459 RepID=A0A0M0GCD5_SPOGL|nr:replication protein [Sporosarcina globispora]KON87423.1 hypothetical protein AF332_11695 [Sporosarcina globispora]
MPWAKRAYEITLKVYKEALADFVTHPRNEDLIIKEWLVRAEVLKHNFTKRQFIILNFIYTLSFTYGKEHAIIPKLQDFELAGISKKHITEELRKLEAMNVIYCNRNEKLYKIEEPRFWNVPYNVGFNDDRSRELFLLNLKHAGVDIQPIVEKLKEMGY